MGRIRELVLAQDTVYATNTTVRKFIAGLWGPAGSVLRVRWTWEFRESTDITQFQAGVGYELADVENAGDGGTLVGAVTKNLGMQYPTGWTDISSATAGKQLIRPVWLCSNSSASALNLGRVGGILEIEDR